MTTSIGTDQAAAAYHQYNDTCDRAGTPLPENSEDGLRRNLDCAVIETLHDIRREAGFPQADSVKGVFVEGEPAYPGAGILDRTHIQICVRNLDCIKGVFRVPKQYLK